jgi:vancomycin resistance protein VanW
MDFEPKKRGPLRIRLGRLFYTLKRGCYWYFDGRRYAKRLQLETLPYVAFQHQTPLLRELKQVDMWLQYHKINNLRIALQKLNRLIIQPGQVFSYWRLIGNPTKAKGYLEGMTLFYGGFRPGIGGGLCQLSNLIYWMTLHTPLTVTERHRHSYDVFPDANRIQPFGSGATCVYNYRDLQIQNNTDKDYQLILTLTDKDLCGQWRSMVEPRMSYDVYEVEHHMTQEAWGGYMRHNVINRRTVDQEGIVHRDERITENHAIMMYPPFLEHGSV